MPKTSESNLRAIAKFNAEKTTRVFLRLNHNTDADILEKLETVESKNGYIKRLIRQDIEKGGI